jgi:hypothetical protein
VGKTHLTVAIARYLLNSFHQDIFFVDFVATAALASGSPGPARSRDDFWDRLRRVSLLIVDNFAMAAPPENVTQMTEKLLRLRRESKRQTLFTGNRLSCRELFRGRSARCDTPTQHLLSSFHPSFLMEYLGGLKVLTIDGENYQKHAGLNHRRLF